MAIRPSSIRTLTVGSGLSPGLPQTLRESPAEPLEIKANMMQLAGSAYYRHTAGRGLHPAPKVNHQFG